MVGWRLQPELLSIYDQHAILLFPSLFGGFGKAPFEAMARGLCVVAANVGGMRDGIRHGVNGLLHEPGDVAAAKTSVLDLVNDFDSAQRMGASAREHARRYTCGRCAEQCVRLYGSLLKTKGEAD